MANWLLFILFICSSVMISNGLRIKRSENQTTDVQMQLALATANESIATTGSTTELPLKVTTNDSITNSQLEMVTPANKTVANGTTGSTIAQEMTITSGTTPSANGSSNVNRFGKVELILDDVLPLEGAKLHRGKRRFGRIDEVLMPSHQARHRRHHGGPLDGGQGPSFGPSPPYVYYNKMISPDGKQEVKEFEILAPNMMIESVQQELNCGPDQDLGGLLLLNAAETKNTKHHRKHKPSSVMPPMLYMLQHLIQSANNMDNPNVEPVRQSRRSPEAPLYQFLDNAVDLALRNNHDVIEHMMGDNLELNHDNILDKNKDKAKVKNNDKKVNLEMEKDKELHGKTKGIVEVLPPRKEDELIVSCPIHHEHHANKNGELVDDDVVLVNECHFV